MWRQRNQIVVVGWLFLWQLAFLLATVALRKAWVPAGPVAILVAILPTLLGVAMLFAYKRFLRRSDELQRKIQLDALAFGFGSGLVAAVAYQLLERAGAGFGAEVADLAAFMMVAYAIGVLLGTRRYA